MHDNVYLRLRSTLLPVAQASTLLKSRLPLLVALVCVVSLAAQAQIAPKSSLKNSESVRRFWVFG